MKMEGQELYQGIVSKLKDTYLQHLGKWKEYEKGCHQDDGAMKYFEIDRDNHFIGVTVKSLSGSSQPRVRVALFPLSHFLPDEILKRIIGKSDVFTDPCFVQGQGSGETFNRVCYTIDDAERPVLAARDYLQFVTQDGYKEIVDQYNKRVVELEDEMEKVEAEFVKKLEELVGSE